MQRTGSARKRSLDKHAVRFVLYSILVQLQFTGLMRDHPNFDAEGCKLLPIDLLVAININLLK